VNEPISFELRDLQSNQGFPSDPSPVRLAD
jgi:hypothetical protein